jgi:aspartate aminotransferase
MFETVAAAPPDPILGLGEAFQNDSRASKINLTIGVYRDDKGRTPILESVKKAESKLLATEATKGYLGIDGLADFNRLVTELTMGTLVDPSRIATAQTPGGTGALKVAADFLAKCFPQARVWCSNPTWPNHFSLFEVAGLETKVYPYLAADKRSLDIAAFLDTLERDGRAGDVVCLHACCHNPTGIDPTPSQWEDIAELTAQRGILPLVDFAYHGFGDGLEEDRVGIKAIAKQHEEFFVCSSYSKNFGLYSERVGALMAVCPTSEVTSRVASSIKQSVRANYSNPPRHGAATVATILADAELKALWLGELAAMRERIHSVRKMFVDGMRSVGCPTDFSFLLAQRGMFSFSGLNPMQVDWLRSEKAIYMVGSGRINVAGITSDNLQALCFAINEAVVSKA